MAPINNKFAKLGIDNAPGQEGMRIETTLAPRGTPLPGIAVDFSHGDVDAFPPIPGTLETFVASVREGGKQAYTEYRGRQLLRENVAAKLSAFTGIAIDSSTQIILTPGTQGALFLAMGSLIVNGDKVGIVEPDYFANRKLVDFFGGELIPIRMHYEQQSTRTGIDLKELEAACKAGIQLFLFSNPNNPVGDIYSEEEIRAIAALAEHYNVAVIVDELYSRQLFDGRAYSHLCKVRGNLTNLVTIIGPSKTESLSGYRLGVAFGAKDIIDRMEKLQAIVSLRAGGYNQAVLKNWFDEPTGWMADRIAAHQVIRDELVRIFRQTPGVVVRPTEAGSYLFVQIPELEVSLGDFIKILRRHAGVTVTPGTEFGPQFLHHFRLNFSQDRANATDAVKRICVLIERYRKS